MPSDIAHELWAAVLGNLEIEVARHSFGTWLKGTSGLSLRGDRLTVAVPSFFVAASLERRLAPLIETVLKDVAQREIEVVYVVDGAGAASGTEDSPPALDSNVAAGSRKKAPRRRHGSPLNRSYTFETFVVGKSNRFAHAAAMAVAENPGQTSYNPLFIHSGVGLGKTHLLHAIGHAVSTRGLNFLYASAEQFTNDFVTALRDGRLENFRDKYRTLDVLLIDDIQFIAGKEHSRESFFHTFNDLHTSGSQIVIASDSHPKSIPLLQERLRSRFEGGLMVDINPPDLETRLAIIGKKAQKARVRLDPQVMDFLARKFLRNIRELEGALNRLLAMSFMSNRPIDLELAHQALAEAPTSPARLNRQTPSEILDRVATYYGFTPQDLAGTSRKQAVSLARQVAAYFLREDTTRSLSDIGRLLGNRGHTTVLRAHAKIAYEIDVSADLQRQIGEIRDSLERGDVTVTGS